MSHKQPVSVLVLIHTPDLEILLLERANHPGYWQSVTGSREGDERLVDTAVRETREETGIAVAPEALVDWHLSHRFEIYAQWRNRYAPGVTHNTEHVFALCVPRHTPITLAPDEHVAYCWLPWQEAAARVFSWTNRAAIEALPSRRARQEPCQQPPATS